MAGALGVVITTDVPMSGQHAQPVYVDDTLPIVGPSRACVVTTGEVPQMGGPAIPVRLAPAGTPAIGPALPVYVVSGSLSSAVAAPSFSPSDITGLQVWYKADTLALANGAAVTSWADSSGNSNTVTQVDPARQPTYQTNQTPNGTKPIIRWDGADDILSFTSNVVHTGDFTMFWCAKMTSVACEIIGNSNNTTFFEQQTTTAMRARNDASSLQTLANAAISLTTYYRVIMVRSGTTWTRYVNGVSDGTMTLGGTFTYNELGARSGSPVFAGDMAEFGAYSVALTTGQIASLNSYLQTRFF